MTIAEIYTAINWLAENHAYKLRQWIVDTFGSESILVHWFTRNQFADMAREIAEYDLCVQLELVELMYN